MSQAFVHQEAEELLARYFVTRHEGARGWARRHGIAAEFIEHLDDPNMIQPDDEVMGTLPLHLIDALLRRGARYFNLDLESTPLNRGLQMTAEDMERAGAKLVEYSVARREDPQFENDEWKPDRSHIGQRALRGLSKLFLILVVFLLAVSTNIAATALWAGLSRAFGDGAISLLCIGLTSSIAFAAGSVILYRNRHRILDLGARITDDPTEAARRVLIMGLSPLSGKDQLEKFERLKQLVQETKVSLEKLGSTRTDLLKEEFGSGIDWLPWLQNLRAVHYHRRRLKLILIVAASKSYEMKSAFNDLIRTAIDNSSERGVPGIDIKWVGQGIDYEDYNAVQGALEEAVKRAKKAGYPDTEISIDVTAGFKPFGIVAAAMTLGPDRHFLYVNTDGKPRSYNATIKVAGGLFGE